MPVPLPSHDVVDRGRRRCAIAGRVNTTMRLRVRRLVVNRVNDGARGFWKVECLAVPRLDYVVSELKGGGTKVNGDVVVVETRAS
jgi:hypothetical protein